MSKQGIFTDRPNDRIGSTWSKYASKIYKQCVCRTQCQETAKDLFQDVALKFCKNARNLNLEESLDGWFSTVVRNANCDRVRRVYTELPMSSLLDERAEYNAFPDSSATFYNENARKQQVQDAVNKFIETLSPVEKMLIEGTFIADVPLSVLSRDIGISRSLLWRKRRKALQKMKKRSAETIGTSENFNGTAVLLESLLV